ncbi:MAG: MarP family serine protease [Actinomycetota bacterium]
MAIIDWVLIGAFVIFAWTGWRQGFIAGVFSFVGFLGGGALVVWLLPARIEEWIQPSTLRLIALIGAVILGAILGQVLLSILGHRIRAVVVWKPARVVDHALGAGLNVLALAVMLWVLASALAYAPFAVVSDQVSASRVLTTLDSAVPSQARDAFYDVTGTLAETAVPRIVVGAGDALSPEVEAPDASVVDPVVEQARSSIVKIVGDARQCDQVVSGSGFVLERGLIATNAHVVAGAADLRVRVRSGISSVSATVIYFDPDTDIALLSAPDLDAPPVDLVLAELERGTSVVTAGFPGGSRFTAKPARVRDVAVTRGESIYGDPGVRREVYVLRGEVEPGISGGPVLTEDGRVAGMVFAAGVDEPDVAYALTSQVIAEASALSGTEPVPNGSCEVVVRSSSRG